MKIIAETAAHHEGDFVFMQTLVQKIAKCPAEIAKVHITLDIDEYMTKDHSVYDLLNKWMFSTDQWQELWSILKSSGKDVMTLVNDSKALEFAKLNNPSHIEIHSVALNDINLLAATREVIGPKTKLVLGVGGSTIEEIDSAVNYIGSSDIILMFGFQNYPTQYTDINFNKIRRIMRLYPQFEFGYADHTAWDEPNNLIITLMGASLGMSYIEKHVSHVPGEKRADAAAVVDFDFISDLDRNLSVLRACNGNGTLSLNEGERKYCVFGQMKKAAILKTEVPEGFPIDIHNVAFKRTGTTSDLSQVDFLSLAGRLAMKSLPAGRVLMRSDFR